MILKVGDAIGALRTILLLAADSVIGSMLLRSQGRAVWRRFNETLAAGRMPHREVLDGVLVIFGGAFLITPGFLTDIVGLLLLLPPTRSLIRRLVARRLGRRVRSARPRRALRRRGHRHRDDAPRQAARAVSAAALALSFFDPDRGLHGTARSGATLLFHGRSRPPTPRARGRRRTATAGGPSSATGWRCGSSRSRRGRAGRRHGPHLPRHRRGRRARGRRPRHVLGHDRRAALGGAGGAAHHLRDRRRAPRPAAARPPPARRGGPRRRAGAAPAVRRRRAASRSRRRASRPSTTAAGASAAPGWSCGCRARSSRAAARGT